MDSKEKRIHRQYSFWFSYHLSHAQFNKTDGLRHPWTICGDCAEALKVLPYTSPTGEFGLPVSKRGAASSKVFKKLHAQTSKKVGK